MYRQARYDLLRYIMINYYFSVDVFQAGIRLDWTFWSELVWTSSAAQEDVLSTR